VLIGARDADQLTDLLKEHAVPVILASSTGLPLRNDDEYDRTYRLPTVLHEAGVRFALGHITRGAWDLRNLPLQAGQAVAFGLPADVALRAITLSTAEILGISRRQGSLDIGKKATLFVSEGDVMDTLTQRVTLMFIEGRRVDLDNRHKMLYRKYRIKGLVNVPSEGP
jgi:imidazolonepropionase-like amidohydrolase